MSRMALTSVVCLPALLATAALADAPLRLNEVRLEQPGADLDEYIELAGAPGESLAGVSIIVVGDDDFTLPGQQNGVIEEVVDLNAYSIASSGFFLVGEPSLSLAIPNLAQTLNLEGNDNVTIFVVRGFTGFLGQKLDTNDDGTLDVTPWTSVVSSLAVIDNAAPDGFTSDFYYSTTKIGPDNGIAPAAAWLCANTSQWNIGTVDPLAGVDSPGAANQTCVPQGLIINEIRIDQTGTDLDEYFELKGAPGQALDGYTYIVIGDGSTAATRNGVIEFVKPLTGLTLGSDGLALFAQYATLANAGGTVDYLITPLVSGGMFENSDNVTHMLVQGFTGTLNQDLDTNEDGVLDITPWASIADAVALVENNNIPPLTGDEYVYAPTGVRVGPDGINVPGQVYRCTPNGTWSIGAFDLASPNRADTPSNPNVGCTTCGPGAGNCHAVHATPGCVDVTCCNLVCVADPTCCSVDWDQACVNQARTSCLAAGAPPVLAFNEIRADDQTNTDVNEYIEITGVPGTNLNGVSIIVIGDGVSVNGNVEAVISLNGTAIPKDGVFLVAESTFTLGTPDAVRSMNLENGDSVTYMLVWNFTGLTNTDVDTNDDCTIDAPTWDAVIDSVGLVAGDGRCVYSAATVGPAYSGFPAHVVKCADGHWGIGRLDTAAVDGFGTPGTANTACPLPNPCGNPKAGSCYQVHTTPGCADAACCNTICVIDVTCCEVNWDATCADAAELQCFTPANPPAVTISEFRIDQPGVDNDEYFEIYGAPNTLLNGLTYIVIGDGTGGSGVIESATPLTGHRIPADGFFLCAHSTLTLAPAANVDLVTTGFSFENDDNVTHMIVFGYTGTLQQDLDTNDDGVLDITPWTTIVNSVAVVRDSTVPPPVGIEWVYSTNIVGPDTTGTSPVSPRQAAFCPSTNTWTIGPNDPATTPGADTPGASNTGCVYSAPCPADLDHNGVVGSSDLAALLNAWGSADPAADLDHSGSVGSADLAAVLNAWGACP